METAPSIHVVLNVGSGNDDAGVTRTTIAGILNDAGRKHEILVVEDAGELAKVAGEAVRLAQASGGMVVAAGGDGTINAVAQATLGSGCTFGVLPQGTFNYFSRTYGIPFDTADATRVLLTGRIHPVQVGLVNGRVFLVNASVGLYPQLLEDREAYKKRYGRSRIVAFGAGLITLLGQHRRLHLQLERGGKVELLRTPTLFVGNNRLQLEQIGIPEPEAVERGELAAIMLRPVRTFEMIWLLLRGALGQLGDAPNVINFKLREMTVKTSARHSRRIKVATDGEVVWLDTPLEFAIAPEPLRLMVPNG